MTTALVTLVALVALPHAAGLADPARPSATHPRCVVIGPPPRPGTPSASPAQPGASVVVAVPRIRCTGQPAQPPTGGIGGGAASGSTGGSGGGLPFTGADVTAALAASALLVLLGALFQRVGRRPAD